MNKKFLLQRLTDNLVRKCNKKFLLSLILIVECSSVFATDFYRMGETTYSSEGVMYVRIGDRTIGSDGTRYTHSDNVTYSSEGKRYESVNKGEFIHSSDGVIYSRMGDFYFGTDGSIHHVSGK